MTYKKVQKPIRRYYNLLDSNITYKQHYELKDGTMTYQTTLCPIRRYYNLLDGTKTY